MMPREPGTEFEALRNEIRHGRAELGETVEALAAKADVRANAGRVARDTVNRAASLAQMVIQRPVTWILVALGTLVVVSTRRLVRRRR